VSADGGQAAGRAFDPTTTSIMPTETVTTLLLLRHGEVEEFGERVVRGQFDAALSQTGVKQHLCLSDWMVANEPKPDQLYTSDLRRCAELSALLAGAWSLRSTSTSMLREQSMGRWEGRTWDDITAEDGALVTAYWDDYLKATPPEGESLQAMSQRVGAWWAATLAKHAGQRLVVSTHIGVIRALLCDLLDVPLTDALRFAPAVGSSTEVLISDAGAVLTRLGERPWMWSAPS
jgi:alpha-ribazole phosphatase